ncbi:MAG: DHH family phosphoesterase [Bacteroidales bacterium]|jgi:phosphoesterase RecJ-like protein
MTDILEKEQIYTLWSLISSARKILIISHTNPDGDAIGSVTAMRHFLSTKKNDSVIVVPNCYPDYLEFLDKDKEILIYKNQKAAVDEYLSECDLIIALDFNQLSRVDDLEKILRRSDAKKILIDHHPDPENEYFDLVISTTEISSTCELLYWSLLAMERYANRDNPDKLNLLTASSLYVGLMTDTNNFSNSVFSTTFQMAADLIMLGIDKEKLQHYVFGGFTESRMRLLGYLLQKKMVILPELEAGYIVLTKEEQQQFDFAEGDSEGFVNMPLNIRGVSVSALFTESADNIRVSLRSIDDFSVNDMARNFFNGGGHERASGGKLFMPIEKVPEYFIESLRKMKNLIIAILLGFLTIMTGCTKQDKEIQLAQQIKDIDVFTKSQVAGGKRLVVNEGSSRVVIAEGAGDSLMVGDSVAFDFAGYVFQSGLGTLFETNVQEIAENLGINIYNRGFDFGKGIIGKSMLIDGLDKGLKGAKKGEHAYIVFPANLGFDKKDVGLVPKMSPLIYEVWIKTIKKN